MTNAEAIELHSEGEVETEQGLKLGAVEVGEWEQDYKYQNASVIFTDGARFYATSITRSGSPFTDWEYIDYGDADVNEVQKVSVVVERWVSV